MLKGLCTYSYKQMLQMEKAEGVFDKLKKHLPEKELRAPRKKALTCIKDLLTWVKTALKKSESESDDNKINKLEKPTISSKLREELHVRKI